MPCVAFENRLLDYTDLLLRLCEHLIGAFGLDVGHALSKRSHDHWLVSACLCASRHNGLRAEEWPEDR